MGAIAGAARSYSQADKPSRKASSWNRTAK